MSEPKNEFPKAVQEALRAGLEALRAEGLKDELCRFAGSFLEASGTSLMAGGEMKLYAVGMALHRAGKALRKRWADQLEKLISQSVPGRVIPDIDAPAPSGYTPDEPHVRAEVEPAEDDTP